MNHLPAQSGHRSTVIATGVNWLSNRLVTSASATYSRIGLGWLEARVVMELGRRPHTTASRVAENLGCDAAAVSRAVKALKTRKLIAEARASPRSLSLVGEGKALYHQIEQIAAEREVRLLRNFTEQETERVLTYLQRMLDNMGDVASLAEEVSEITGHVRTPAQAP